MDIERDKLARPVGNEKRDAPCPRAEIKHPPVFKRGGEFQLFQKIAVHIFSGDHPMIFGGPCAIDFGERIQIANSLEGCVAI